MPFRPELRDERDRRRAERRGPIDLVERGPPDVPSEFLRELVAGGVLDPSQIRTPPERCHCTHVRGAHAEGTGHCRANKCGCQKWDLNPRSTLPRGPKAEFRKVPMKVLEDAVAAGTIKLERA